jgi:AcrR family transcriptional regulator
MSRTAGSTAPDTRARILGAALDLFRERGFAGTSIRDLATSAGVTTAALYYHFDGKDQILDALVDPFLEGLRTFTSPPAEAFGPTDEQLLDDLASLLIAQGPAIQAVMTDLSAARHLLHREQFRDVIADVERVLAGNDDPADLLRARCAFGALQRGFLARRATAGPVADQETKAVILAAALAALRSRPPGAPGPTRPTAAN